MWPDNALDAAHAFFKAVLLERGVGKCHAHAVLAEPVRLDAQLQQQVEDGRGLQAVALEFDDGQPGHGACGAVGVVDKGQRGVDGESLGAGAVHQRDALELILQRGYQRPVVVTQPAVQKLVDVAAALPDHAGPQRQIVGGQGHALFVGALVVVLGLHLQVVQPRGHIRPHAQFLAVEMPVLVHDIHRALGGVEVQGVVGRQTQAIGLLGAVLAPSQLKQSAQHRHRCHKLGVGAVHQLDGAHLLERDGAELLYDLIEHSCD